MKTPRQFLTLSSALMLALSARAQVTLNDSLEAFVRGGPSNSGVDQNEATTGYIMVKNDPSPFSNARKAYFKFDFNGQNPNTNAVLKLRFTTYTANGRQHVQLWTLDQDYPGFTSQVLTWNDAQANDTAGNGMLTNGPLTATPRTEFISPNSAGQNPSYVIPPPWGNALINDKLHLVLGTIADATNNANGTRITPNTAALEFFPLNGGAPPAISSIADISTVANENSVTNSFTVGDPEDGPNNLFPVASSSNEGVVSSANVYFEGSGADRKLYVIGSAAGFATITVTVTDNVGNNADRLFNVTVLPQNFAPFLTTPAPTNTPLNTPVTIPFTVGDAETPADGLTVTAAAADYSAALISDVTIQSDASGTNRNVVVTPFADANGVAIIRITVSDPEGNSTTVAFGVMVLAAPNVVFNDHFDYPTATVGLFPGSANFWARRSAAAGSVNFATQNGTAYIRPKSGADDAAAQLAGGPYTPESRAVLYTECSATWVDVGGELATNSVGGGFLDLSQSGAATSILVADVATSTNSAPDGRFNLGLWDVNGVVQPFTGVTIPTLGGPYTIVTRYDVAKARSTLWVDAASEADPYVSASDANTPVSIGYVGLRQDQGMGYIFVDDLQVKLAIAPMVTSGGLSAGGNVDLFFSAGTTDAIGDFAVEGASTVTGSYNNVAATITSLGSGNFKATVPIMSPDQGFYRVKRRPMTF